MSDRYNDARQLMIDEAERTGFAAKTCPVGCCHPTTLERLAPPPNGLLCERHYRKLSGPFAKQLATARKYEADKAKVTAIEARAVEHARKSDDLWRPYVLREREAVTGFASWRDAATALLVIVAVGELAPTLESVKTAKLLENDAVRAWCPHRVTIEYPSREQYRSQKIEVLGDSDKDRPESISPIAWALTQAWTAGTGSSPHVYGRAKVTNGWTGEIMTFERACEIAARVGGWKR